jgi:hypothetical protein
LTDNADEQGDLAPLWEFGDIGFDTVKLQWFVQLFDEKNQLVSMRFGRRVAVTGGNSLQYQWKDSDGRPFWHIRERFFSHNVESITETANGTITMAFRDDDTVPEEIPTSYSYLLYAYHLRNKSSAARNAPFGFVDFFDESDRLLKRIDRKWIIIEGLKRRTSGTYPNIRLRVDYCDIGSIKVTSSCIILAARHK